MFVKDLGVSANRHAFEKLGWRVAEAGAAVLTDDEKDGKKNAARIKPILESMLCDNDRGQAMAAAKFIRQALGGGECGGGSEGNGAGIGQIRNIKGGTIQNLQSRTDSSFSLANPTLSSQTTKHLLGSVAANLYPGR
jgi:hypothetical protein